MKCTIEKTININDMIDQANLGKVVSEKIQEAFGELTDKMTKYQFSLKYYKYLSYIDYLYVKCMKRNSVNNMEGLSAGFWYIMAKENELEIIDMKNKMVEMFKQLKIDINDFYINVLQVIIDYSIDVDKEQQNIINFYNKLENFDDNDIDEIIKLFAL